MDYTDIIEFHNYIENEKLKNLPNICHGVIPNYKYVIGNNNLFEENNKNVLYKTRFEEYYLIELKIPFSMELD